MVKLYYISDVHNSGMLMSLTDRVEIAYLIASVAKKGGFSGEMPSYEVSEACFNAIPKNHTYAMEEMRRAASREGLGAGETSHLWLTVSWNRQDGLSWDEFDNALVRSLPAEYRRELLAPFTTDVLVRF